MGTSCKRPVVIEIGLKFLIRPVPLFGSINRKKLSTRCFCHRLLFCAVPLVFMSHCSCHCQGRCVYLSLLELSGFHKWQHIAVNTIVGMTHKHANADVLRQWCVCCVLHEGSSWQKQDKELLTMPSTAVLSEHDSGGS